MCLNKKDGGIEALHKKEGEPFHPSFLNLILIFRRIPLNMHTLH